jgi:hypothetical protein
LFKATLPKSKTGGFSVSDNDQIMRQRPVTLSDHLVEQYSETGTREYGDEQLRQASGAIERSKSKHDAELARLTRQEIAGTAQQNRQPAPPPGAPLARDEYANLSSRQKKKLLARREKGLSQARKKYGPEATEDTLPMMAQLREYNKSLKDARSDEPPIPLEEAVRGVSVDADMFDKPFAEGADTAFDVKDAMARNKAMKDILSRFDALAPDEAAAVSLSTQARMAELRVMQASFEGAVRTVLAANGVDFDTGGPLSAEQTARAKTQKAAATAAFREIVANRNEALLDNLANLSEAEAQAKYDEQITEERVNQEENYNVHGLPFTITYEPTLEEFAKVKNGIDANPENYGAHREAIDRMLSEYLDICNRMSDISRRGKAYSDLGEDAQANGDYDLYRQYNDLAERCNNDPSVGEMNLRRGVLATLMRYLTEGRDPGESWLHVTLEDEFGIVTEERRQQKEAVDVLDAMEEQNRQTEAELAERQERQRMLEEELPYCDEHCFAMSDAIKRMGDRKNQAMNDANAAIQGAPVRVDQRMLKVFCQGYDVGSDGEPVSREDTDRKTKDMQFISDYCSGNAERRRPHLYNAMDRILKIARSVSPAMLTEDYMTDNAAQMKEMCDRLYYFENIMQENRAYFDNLDPAYKKVINAAYIMATSFVGYTTAAFNARGIDINRGRFYGEEESPIVMNARESVDTFREQTLYAIRVYEYERARVWISHSPYLVERTRIRLGL